ncbi:unnamed protein product [Protopolystoma xenopodis]|uniref:Uncharacterized protein n=1 Tax=Protopolystoma xenopodis TaxID=117903 RepID=A0A3S5BNP5_9PLAT|nr:unnamed protein product [Protopolystoma xenopodis]
MTSPEPGPGFLTAGPATPIHPCSSFVRRLGKSHKIRRKEKSSVSAVAHLRNPPTFANEIKGIHFGNCTRTMPFREDGCLLESVRDFNRRGCTRKCGHVCLGHGEEKREPRYTAHSEE